MSGRKGIGWIRLLLLLLLLLRYGGRRSATDLGRGRG